MPNRTRTEFLTPHPTLAIARPLKNLTAALGVTVFADCSLCWGWFADGSCDQKGISSSDCLLVAWCSWVAIRYSFLLPVSKAIIREIAVVETIGCNLGEVASPSHGRTCAGYYPGSTCFSGSEISPCCPKRKETSSRNQKSTLQPRWSIVEVEQPFEDGCGCGNLAHRIRMVAQGVRAYLTSLSIQRREQRCMAIDATRERPGATIPSGPSMKDVLVPDIPQPHRRTTMGWSLPGTLPCGIDSHNIVVPSLGSTRR